MCAKNKGPMALLTQKNRYSLQLSLPKVIGIRFFQIRRVEDSGFSASDIYGKSDRFYAVLPECIAPFGIIVYYRGIPKYVESIRTVFRKKRFIQYRLRPEKKLSVLRFKRILAQIHD